MKRPTLYSVVSCALVMAAPAPAKTIVVNTADNTDFTSGKTNLVTAIRTLEDGDTITFNIPGTGVHEIDTPAGGYPLITRNNVTIDGYTQPGAVPNSNPIHAANNAQIKILLSSTNGNALSMGASIAAFTGHAYNNLGFGPTEMAILGFFRGTNALVRGLAIQSASSGSDGVNSGDMKSISFCPDSLNVTPSGLGNCAYWRVSGCWWGLDPATGQIAFMPDGTNVAYPTICIAAYRTQNDDGTASQFAAPATIGVAKDASDPRADFNVIITGYGFDSEGHDWRISGNFWNVLPDGMHNFDVSQWNGGAQAGDGYIESGRYNANVLIGTDGDGVNDADEGNVFGGSQAYSAGAYKGIVGLYFWGTGTDGPGTNCVVAGNYFGVAVDGATRFTNAMVLVHDFAGGGPASAATVRFGSDFDGVSDAQEANLIYNNFPLAAVYPALGSTDPAPISTFDGTKDHFGGLSAGLRMSFRGNSTVGNGPIPFNFFAGGGTPGGLLTSWTNYEAPFMATNGSLVPVLNTNNVFPNLQGSYPPGVAPYTNVSIDVYQADLEGWSNGIAFAAGDFGTFVLTNELTDGATYTNGFAQGSTYLGSFVMPDNSGNFNIKLPATMDLGVGAVTVTANYSADAPGTHNGRVQTGNFSNPGYLYPAGADAVGLTRVVPDNIVWYDTNAESASLGSCVPASEGRDNANWEGYTSLVSDSLFLITYGTYTAPLLPPPPGTGGSGAPFTNQNFIVVKQPAAGGTPSLDWSYYGDYQNGTPVPVKGVMNLSRDNGNPPRVAGDLRYGSKTMITMTEASLGQIAQFQSTDNRWTNNPIYGGIDRYVCEQLFNLNGLPGSLAQTPVTNAWDYVYGATVASALGTGADSVQCSRTGGRANFLDNGNIVVMIDDKTALQGAGGEVTTFSIITPQGNIVKGPTLAKNQDIWDNMCAYRGGFAIRVHNSLLFFDNSGSMTYSNDINASSGLTYDTGRADASRLGSDIRGHYVYLAGQSPQNGPTPSGGAASGQVFLSAWDSRTGNFAGSVQVDDGQPGVAGNDRVSVAADDLDRVCVAWSFQPDTKVFTNRQVAARVFQFTGTRFTPFTHSFFAFVNHDSDPAKLLGFETYHPSVAMTRRQICISAKGKLNSTNNAAAGPDTVALAGASGEAKVYTVFNQPAPVAAPRPELTIARVGGNLNLSWNADAGLFTVQTTGQVKPSGTVWTDVTVGNVAPPVSVMVASTNKFVRLIRRY